MAKSVYEMVTDQIISQLEKKYHQVSQQINRKLSS